MMAPLKLLGNFYDLVNHAFLHSIQKGRLDLYHATTIPITIALLAQFKAIFYVLLNPFKTLRGQCGPVLIFILAFLVIVAANPYVHSRYIWPILPLLILVLIGVKKTRPFKRSMKIPENLN